MKFKDLSDKTFGKLTVLEKTDKRVGPYVVWKCLCACGNITYVTSRNLITGHTQSCGCISREKASKRLKEQKFVKSKEDYRKNNFLKDGTSLALINSKKIRKNNSTGVNGVYLDKKLGKYRARITLKGKVISLGCFASLKEAALVREKAEEKYFKPIIEKYKDN